MSRRVLEMAKRNKLKAPKPQETSRSLVHDRRATDLPINARVAPVEVDDPYEAGAKILAFRNIRDDPLSRMYARQFIDDAQWRAGTHWQNAYERAEGGARSIDMAKDVVDGGKFADPLTDQRIQAFRILGEAADSLDVDDESLIRDVLAKRLFIKDAAVRRGLVGERAIQALSKKFKDCLDILAVVYGFAMRSKNHTIPS